MKINESKALVPEPLGAFVISELPLASQTLSYCPVYLSLVIPTYQESKNIAHIVRLISKLLDKVLPDNYELIVVDDNSPDYTWEIAQNLLPDYPQLRVMRRQRERGLATAVIRGWQAARGQILGVIDGDLQHPPEVLLKLLTAIEHGEDLAVASRHVEEGGVSDWNIVRRFLSRGAQTLGLIVLPEVIGRVSDPMSGYFLVHRHAIAGYKLNPVGYKILIEVLGQGNIDKISEVGYLFQERQEGKSKVTSRQYIEYLQHLLRLRLSRGRVGRLKQYIQFPISRGLMDVGYMQLPRSYIPVFLIIGFSIFLRFFLLDNQSLWYDEGMSLNYSDGVSFSETFSRILGREAGDKYQPLYYLVLFAWRSLFGDTEFALRSLSALLGVGSVITIFFTTLRIYGKNHSIWSSLILAVSSFCIYYSQETRAYSLLIFLASLQLYFFRKALDEDEEHKFVSQLFFGIVTAIGLFGSILMGIFSAALCISHAIVYRNLRQWLQWWLSAACFSAPVIFFYLSSSAVTDPTSTSVTRSGFPIIQNAIFVLYGILTGTTYGPPLIQLRGEDRIQVMLNYWPHFLILCVVVSIIFFPLVGTLFKSYKSRKYQKEQRANFLFSSLFAISFLLAFLFAAYTKINWLPRHSFYLCLPVAILIPSVFIHRYKHRLKHQRKFQYAKVAAIVLVVLNIYSLFNYYFNQSYWREDYRSAAEYLQQNRDAYAQSILLRGNTRLLKYYGDAATIHGWPYLTKLKDKHFDKLITGLTDNANTVFIAVNREYRLGSNPKSLIEKAMSDSYTLNSKVDFRYMSIYKFVKK